MMPYFRSQPPAPRLPEGYGLVMEDQPVDAPAVNRFLQHCGAPARSDSTIARALEASAWTVRLLRNDQLVGLCAYQRSSPQRQSLGPAGCARRTPGQAAAGRVGARRPEPPAQRAPGCSISLASPPQAIEVLETFDFITDPNGIRAMGLDL